MRANRRLANFASLVKSGGVEPPEGSSHLGVDLGTGNVVLAVADAQGKPVAGARRSSSVVRDGIVVDWLGAVRVVSDLKHKLEERIGTTFEEASISIPPGVDTPTAKIFTNVLEACEMRVVEVLDEPVAAARALGIDSGAVIDIGHGTTGISVLHQGEVTMSTDEATGGHHMTLVLAGALGIDYEAAEALKRNRKKADLVFGVVRPTLEKMATIAAEALSVHEEEHVFLVGGASSLPRSVEVFSDVLGVEVTHTPHPLYPTPLGTALRRADD